MTSNRMNLIARLKAEFKKSPTVENDVIAVLKAEFKKNPSTEARCIESARSYIDRKIPNRLFNNFPCLITAKQLHQLSHQFITIFDSIREQHITDDLNITDPIKLQQLSAWEKRIINLASTHLLDKTGHVKDSLLETLQLQSYKTKLNANDVISSFVALIHEYILEDAKKAIKKRPAIYPACYTFLNSHQQQWITEEHDKLEPKEKKQAEDISLATRMAF